jgi:hypothetical protein
VIAQAYLNEWASQAPWPQQAQVEQDLVLSRLIVEIARHDLLGGELTFRGGTCLHKLHLPKQLLVLVGCADQLAQKVRQILRLGEARELGGVVEPDVEQALDAGCLQATEEVLSRRLCETDCVDLHAGSSSPNNDSCPSPKPRATESSWWTTPFGRI